MPPTRSRSRNSWGAGSDSPELPPWWRPRWRPRRGPTLPGNRRASTKRSPSTIIFGYWRPGFCPKLPQRHSSVVSGAPGGVGAGGFEAMNFDFLHGLATFGIIPFLIVLTIVVFFHELGHFLVARWCGVKVDAFSIGFGPELFGFNDRHQTRWKVCAIPLGGYVKFFGDENAASVPDHAAATAMSEDERGGRFVHQSVGPRAAIVVAGPIADFILSVVIFAGIFMSFGRQVIPARGDAVQPDSAPTAAGLKPGDLIVAIDGRPIGGFSEMQRIVAGSSGRTLTLTIDRGGVRED